MLKKLVRQALWLAEYEIKILDDGSMEIPSKLAGLLGFSEKDSILSIEEINEKLASDGRAKIATKIVDKDGKMIYIPDFSSITSNNETCS